MLKLTIEDDQELLKRYGLAVALYSSIDLLLGAFIRIEGGLHRANQDIVNQLLNDKTFGPKIELTKSLISNKILKTDLDQGLKDRNALAHGVSVEDQNGQKLLMVKKEFQSLTVADLDLMIERARKIGEGIVQEIQKHAKIK